MAIDCHRQMVLLAKEGRDFPLRQRRAVSFREIVRDFLEYSWANKITARQDEQRMRYWLEAFGDRAAEAITPRILTGTKRPWPRVMLRPLPTVSWRPSKPAIPWL